MHYLHKRTQQILEELCQTGSIPVVDDVTMGWDYLGAVLDGDIKEHDIVLMVSLDGAQLYDSKESDCWMYVWATLNLLPDQHYHKLHVLPGGFMPGPNKPKNVNSLFFPGFHHLAALQHEGFLCGTCSPTPATFLTSTSFSQLLMAWVSFTGMGWWAIVVKMDAVSTVGELHNFNVFNLPEGSSSKYGNNLKKIVSVHNQTQWDKMKTETGLTKPPLILGLYPTHSLGVPLSITTDIMHLASNLSDLLLSLWCGTIDVAPNDNCTLWDWAALSDRNVWIAHGQDIENTGQHLPGSYDHKPHNIAKKSIPNTRLGSFNFTPSVSPLCFYAVSSLWSTGPITLQDVQALLCNWEYLFERMYYQLKGS
ncbi:hypothetical protein PAXRUDRAFT_18925 [Paxillus rubicundulus Ve08.2h10]|uniref:Uncharacterized protein n=1 Tax=Paxillus rubicundulus Ve08.2h10 TaxID=930991 RepID=A0A0D0BW24_9AGAM|nr:hypothetical protein PAXRUDRAFT_18925 [Paxillus rubicundulus Ve08.2h10]